MVVFNQSCVAEPLYLFSYMMRKSNQATQYQYLNVIVVGKLWLLGFTLIKPLLCACIVNMCMQLFIYVCMYATLTQLTKYSYIYHSDNSCADCNYRLVSTPALLFAKEKPINSGFLHYCKHCIIEAYFLLQRLIPTRDNKFVCVYFSRQILSVGDPAKKYFHKVKIAQGQLCAEHFN